MGSVLTERVECDQLSYQMVDLLIGVDR